MNAGPVKEENISLHQEDEMNKAVIDANIAYHNLIAAEYESDASSRLLFSPATQARLKNTAEFFFNHSDGGLWIDVGCGTGVFSLIFSNLGGVVVGFDLTWLQLSYGDPMS